MEHTRTRATPARSQLNEAVWKLQKPPKPALLDRGQGPARGSALGDGAQSLAAAKPAPLGKLAGVPDLCDAARGRGPRKLGALDNVGTAPVHGSRDTGDYWPRSSAKPLLQSIRVPTLLINARDDPFLPASALPTQREVSSAVRLEFPPKGGHVGFVSGPFPGNIDWLPRRILHFFEHHE